MSKDEISILEKLVSGEFGTPVLLRVETVPFIPPLAFTGGDVTISEDMKHSLLTAGKVFEVDPDMTVTVTSRPAFPATRNRNREAGERAASVAAFLKKEYSIPAERIKIVTIPAGKTADPAITIRILPRDE